MKKTMTAILVLTMIIGLSSFAIGQEAADATVDAVVLANLTITKNFDVDFGNIAATGSPTLNPKGTGHIDVGTTNQVGEFTITGSNTAQISVVFPSEVTLGDGSSVTMTFTVDLEGHADTQGSATDVVSGTQKTLGASGYKFWLGGTLGTLSNQTTGTYASDASNGSGDFTLTVEYY